jgi:hypothetical protein
LASYGSPKPPVCVSGRVRLCSISPSNKQVFYRLTLKPVAGFDVGFDVDVPPHQVTTDHTNRDFGGRGTVPDDMGHDGTAIRARDYQTAALPLSYVGTATLYPNHTFLTIGLASTLQTTQPGRLAPTAHLRHPHVETQAWTSLQVLVWKGACSGRLCVILIGCSSI